MKTDFLCHFISGAQTGEKAESCSEQLKRRLTEFYTKVDNYQAYRETSYKPEFWEPIRREAHRRLREKGTCRILEFGAGKTDFRNYLKDQTGRISFFTQDITDQTLNYIHAHSDKHYPCPIGDIFETFDIIFSTFVWEHIPDPVNVLKHLLGLLDKRGVLFLISPRYDFPFYMSPSCRHYSIFQRFILGMWLMHKRLVTFFFSKPAFIIHHDPAIFYNPWFRDADAIHWVSKFDLQAFLSGDYRMKEIRTNGKGLLQRLWEMLFLLNVRIEK